MATYMRADHGPQFVDGLQDLLKLLPPGLTMAEIGVYAGEGSRIFLGSGKIRTLYAVDPWRPYTQKTDGWRSPFNWFDVRLHFLDWADTQPGVIVCEMASLEAAECFAPHSLDLVYLDACHDYAAVQADMAAWRPTLRPNGWLAGHDFTTAYPGVMQAVQEACYGVTVFPDTSWLCPVDQLRPMEVR